MNFHSFRGVKFQEPKLKFKGDKIKGNGGAMSRARRRIGRIPEDIDNYLLTRGVHPPGLEERDLHREVYSEGDRRIKDYIDYNEEMADLNSEVLNIDRAYVRSTTREPQDRNYPQYLRDRARELRGEMREVRDEQIRLDRSLILDSEQRRLDRELRRRGAVVERNVFGFGKTDKEQIRIKGYGKENYEKMKKDGMFYGEGVKKKTWLKYGRFTALAYPKVKDVENEMKKYKLENWNFDAGLSDHEVKVFYNDKEVIISFRGTDSPKDVLHDLSIIVGLEKIWSARRKKEKKLVKKVMKKYKRDRYTLVGHSLGGKSVMNQMDIYGKKNMHGYMFNGASMGDLATSAKFLLNGKYGRMHNIRVSFDPVSVLNPFKETEIKKKRADNVHTVYNFV